jgi:hypothetical protein
MIENGVIRKRNLPHIDVEGKPSFITACLHGSLPASGLKRIYQYREELNARAKPAHLNPQEWELTKHKMVFKLLDSMLDRMSPVRYLEDERLAEIVQNAFLHFANDRYRLFAFVVMPSHHHWVFLPNEDWSQELATNQRDSHDRRTPREAISHSIQSYTGTHCNRLLGRTGSFWQAETYDHYARDESELVRIIEYIEQNPVVAGLATVASEYRWSSANIRARLGLKLGDAIPKPVVA